MSKKTLREKFNEIKHSFNRESYLKAEKLIDPHLKFAGMSILGSLLLPRAFFLLYLGYAAAYQVYYFSS